MRYVWGEGGVVWCGGRGAGEVPSDETWDSHMISCEHRVKMLTEREMTGGVR